MYFHSCRSAIWLTRPCHALSGADPAAGLPSSAALRPRHVSLCQLFYLSICEKVCVIRWGCFYVNSTKVWVLLPSSNIKLIYYLFTVHCFNGLVSKTFPLLNVAENRNPPITWVVVWLRIWWLCMCVCVYRKWTLFQDSHPKMVAMATDHVWVWCAVWVKLVERSRNFIFERN